MRSITYSVASIFCLQVNQLWAVVPLFGNCDGIIVRSIQVVDLGHDGDEAEHESGAINISGVEDNYVCLAKADGSHAFQMTCRS